MSAPLASMAAILSGVRSPAFATADVTMSSSRRRWAAVVVSRTKQGRHALDRMPGHRVGTTPLLHGTAGADDRGSRRGFRRSHCRRSCCREDAPSGQVSCRSVPARMPCRRCGRPSAAPICGGGPEARRVVLATAGGFCQRQGCDLVLLDLRPGRDAYTSYWPTAFNATFQCHARNAVPSPQRPAAMPRSWAKRAGTERSGLAEHLACRPFATQFAVMCRSARQGSGAWFPTAGG